MNKKDECIAITNELSPYQDLCGFLSTERAVRSLYKTLVTRSCGTWWSAALTSLANEALTKAITPKRNQLKTYVISRSQCYKWFQRFENGNESLEDEEHRRRPQVVDDELLKKAIESDPTQTARKLALEFGCSNSTIDEHLHTIGRQIVPNECKAEKNEGKGNEKRVAERSNSIPKRQKLSEQASANVSLSFKTPHFSDYSVRNLSSVRRKGC
ncbi:hypothetical protein RB195_000710 [Necator americanus]|uniref:Transposase Synechocystis PCC 6803 domain-containing protein n=1 Tax=Necator americanus TaxID=51031 RepID=A0ABR1DB06_NECAM